MKKITLVFLIALANYSGYSQKTYETFRSTRLVNLHTTETLEAGILQFRLAHRFGAVSGGAQELFGLDQATMRIAFEYGVFNNVMVGVGRSTLGKMYDGFLKWKLLEQETGKIPVSLTVMSSLSLTSVPFSKNPQFEFFSSRLAYTSQIIVGKKFNDRFSFQISPTIIHKNLVTYVDDKNLHYALGLAGRYNISKSISINSEYVVRYKNGVDTESYNNFHNSLSFGFGFLTRGHFFELHITNSFPIVEQGFILDTSDDWLDGDIHYGFNLIRDFKINKKRK